MEPLKQRLSKLTGIDTTKPLSERLGGLMSKAVHGDKITYDRTGELQKKLYPKEKLEDVVATAVGELNDDENEMRSFVSVLHNRATNRKMKSLDEVVNDKTGGIQFFGRNNEQAKKYLSGDIDEPTRLKAEKFKKILDEYSRGEFKNTLPGGEEYFEHYDGVFKASHKPPVPESQR